MKNRSSRYPATLVTLAIVLSMACNEVTSFINPTPQILHFENDIVAFDYLEGMKIYEGGDTAFQCVPDFQLGGELVVGLGSLKLTGSDSYFRSIRIFRQPMPSDSNLETMMQKAYQKVDPYHQRDNGVMNASGPVTVAGLSAYQWTYRVYIGEPAYELRDVWIPKEDDLFIIAIWTQYTNPEGFAAFQAGADLILKSLHIKK